MRDGNGLRAQTGIDCAAKAPLTSAVETASTDRLSVGADHIVAPGVQRHVPVAAWRGPSRLPSAPRRPNLDMIINMPNQTVLCDDCMLNLGIQAVPMVKTDPLSCDSSFSSVPFGDAYICRGCGRFYGSKEGYFSFVEGQGMSRIRTHPRCNSEHSTTMYLTQVLWPRRARFACPTCGRTVEDDLLPVPIP